MLQSLLVNIVFECLFSVSLRVLPLLSKTRLNNRCCSLITDQCQIDEINTESRAFLICNRYLQRPVKYLLEVVLVWMFINVAEKHS